VLGFETRTVEDTALLLDVAAARAPERLYIETAGRSPARLKVALSFKMPFPPAPVDAGVRASVEGIAERLRALGHDVVERHPEIGRAMDAFMPRFLGGMAQDAERMARPERLQRRTRGFARMGRAMRPLVERARRDEARHAARLADVFSDHDLLLTPVSARPPVGAAQWEGMSAARTLFEIARVHPYTALWNMTGQPAISIPAAPVDGLPVGAQLIGPADSEGLLLSVAAQLEADQRWFARRPPLS
jgi:amidase